VSKINLGLHLIVSFIHAVKLKLSLYLTTYHAVEAYWGVEVQLHSFLTSALDGGEWSDSRTGRSTTGERTPGIHWIVGWVGLRGGLDAVVTKKSHNLPGIGSSSP
jgi:hypothetical protein